MLFWSSAKAQPNYYIYIESEENQPFYVKYQNQVFSSSETGYLIMSNVSTGAYDLIIGFPKNEWPTEKFTMQISGKDRGWMIKKNQSFFFELMDLVTGEILKPIADTEYMEMKTAIAAAPKEISFEEALVQATGDSQSISKVKQYYSVKEGSVRHLKYQVDEKNQTDTVELYIDEQQQDSTMAAHHKTDMSVAFNCFQPASDVDLIALKKRVQLQKTAIRKIQVAVEGLKQNCYTVLQLKKLTLLLRKDNDRLELLTLSVDLVTDKGNFSSLVSLLVEEKNILQFKKLTQP